MQTPIFSPSPSPIQIRKGMPALILAPMEGITDAPMRATLSHVGGYSHLVSEFIRVSTSILPPRVFRREVPESDHGFKTNAGTSVQVQLLGGDPIRIAESAASALSLGAPGIDLNFGCPAQTVNRNDGGATLLKYPARLEAIVRNVRSEVTRVAGATIPVSAKLRLGWDDPSAILENIRRAEAGGAAWITIHARTKLNGYQPPAYWEWIARARELVSIPVVANGDIWTIEDFRKCREVTGCEHFMIGRGALADPWLSLRISRELSVSAVTTDVAGSLPASAPSFPERTDISAWLPLLRQFAEYSAEYADRNLGITKEDSRYCARRIKQWLRYSEIYWKTDWFTATKRLETLTEIIAELELRATPGLKHLPKETEAVTIRA